MQKLLTTLIFTLTLLCAGLQSASAQTPGTPDCLIPFDTGVGVGAGTYNFPAAANGFDNRVAGCVTWTLQWQSNATATVTFQSSLGVASPSSYGTYTGTTVFSGTGMMTFSNLVTGTVVDTPWVRVQAVTSATGQTKGVLYGYKTGTTGGTGGGGGGGGGGGCTSPCPVEGVDASGAAPTVPPVATAGFDGTDNRRIATDSSGRQLAVGGAASGAVQVGNPIPVAGNDGTDARTLHVDSSGNLDVNVQGTVPVSGVCPNPCPVTQSTSPWVANITQWASTALGLATAWGVAPTGNVPGVNANILSNVQPSGRSTFNSGQQAVTGTAANLGSNATSSVCVHALIGNTINVFAGAAGVTTSTGMELPPGQGYCWNVSNTNLIFVVASTTGASVSFTY